MQKAPREIRLDRFYAIATLVYTAFLVYGCLTPFNLQHIGASEAWRTFISAMNTPQRWGPSDVVTNVIMFVPLTFFALGAWSGEDRREGQWLMIPAIVAAGFGLSVLLEFVQVFSIGRVVSRSDIICQTIGGLIGLGGWLVCGRWLGRWIRDMFSEEDSTELCLRILYTYAALLVLYQLLPLNPTISISQVARRFRGGRIILIPFTDPQAIDLYPLTAKTILYLPVGFLLATRGLLRGRSPWRAIKAGFIFAGALEFAQVFIHGRGATTTDVILGTVGASAGAALAHLFGPAARSEGVHGRWWRKWGWLIKGLALTIWLSALVWKAWYPLRPSWPAGGFLSALAHSMSVPPFDIIRNLNPLTGTARLARELGSYLLVAMLLQSLVAREGRIGSWAMTIVAMGTAICLEVGRLFFETHGLDTTVLSAGLIGCVAGRWAYPQLVAIFLKHPHHPAPDQDSAG